MPITFKDDRSDVARSFFVAAKTEGGTRMAEISKEALVQISKRGLGPEVEKFAKVLGGMYRITCEIEALKKPNKDVLRDLKKKEDESLQMLLVLCRESSYKNTKPVLKGVSALSEEELLRACLDFAETMFRESKFESYEKEK
jgi:hypothetical protein